MRKKVPDPEPWKQPGLGLRGSLNIIEASRKILLGEECALPSFEKIGYPKPNQVTINTRSKPHLVPKATIEIKQVGKHEYNPQGWTTQTGETHNSTQFDTKEFRQTVKALATTGVKAASMETRRGAAFAHWNSELCHLVDVDKRALPTTSNLMAHHKSAKPQKTGIIKAEQTSIQIGNKKWYGKGTTYQTHHGNKLHGAGFQPSTMDKVPALQDHGKLTQRQCDGPDDPMLTHAQMQFYAKTAAKNVTQSEMQTVFGVDDLAAGYIPPNRVPMKKPAATDNKAAGSHPDTVDMLRGKWLDNQWSTPYDTEVKSQFYDKKSSYKKLNNDLKMTASNVVMTNPADAPWPYHTTSASFQEEPATQMMLKPHRTERRGEMYQMMSERTGQVRESMEQGGGSYGPIVVGQRGSAVGRSDDPHAMTGMEYGETSINNKLGVNASEYGNKGAAWNVMPPESVSRPDRHSRITRSQVCLEAAFEDDPRYTYAGDDRGGWYRTAHRDSYQRHTNHRPTKGKYMYPGVGTTSMVQLGEENMLREQDQFNRSVSVSHQQFPGYNGKQYRDPVLEAKYITAERARNASDICLWRSESTGVRYQHQAVEAERGIRKGAGPRRG